MTRRGVLHHVRSEPSDALRIDEVRERITAKLRSAPNDAHYMQVVVGLHDLAALLDDHARLSKMKTNDS